MTAIRCDRVTVDISLPGAVERGFTPGAAGLANVLTNQRSTLREPYTPGKEPPRQNALNGVDLDVRDGESLAILGPSGCGKTTLLRAIAGLVQPTTGKIYYDGRDSADIPVKDRGIGLVFQSYALYPTMTSYGNVGFFFSLRNRQTEIPERVKEVSQVMGIGFEKLLGRRPGTLSGGERQRVAVARCIARDPKLLLFDEPLSNLDAQLRVKTRSELRRLIQRYKVTTLYVTHDQTEALAICDRIAVMNEGRIEQVGSPQTLLEYPANTMVASFLGSPPMNLLPGRMIETGWTNGRFSIPMPNRGFSGRSITLGIRAEHLIPTADGPLYADVSLVEPLLAERAQHVYLESGDIRFVARLPDSTRYSIGSPVRLSIQPESVHLFDTTSGRHL